MIDIYQLFVLTATLRNWIMWSYMRSLINHTFIIHWYLLFICITGIFRLSSSNAELVYSNLAAMVNSSGASGPQQQAAVLFRLGQLGRQLQASGQQPFILPMPNPPAAHQTPADLSSKSSRNKSEIQNP